MRTGACPFERLKRFIDPVTVRHQQRNRCQFVQQTNRSSLSVSCWENVTIVDCNETIFNIMTQTTEGIHVITTRPITVAQLLPTPMKQHDIPSQDNYDLSNSLHILFDFLITIIGPASPKVYIRDYEPRSLCYQIHSLQPSRYTGEGLLSWFPTCWGISDISIFAAKCAALRNS